MNEKEKDDLKILMSLYCKDNCHKDNGDKTKISKISSDSQIDSTSSHKLCTDCLKLLEYAYKCLDKCPYKENKPICSACPIHCYSKEFREQIRTVMRYSGPRMIYHKPSVALRHFMKKLKGK